ncbi:MAG: 50S ribosomal protein L6 [Salinivirgaceae bacterium]|jgi:large subunit ribosomal protein L6|nr:50S ribosomal protein L6 [Salinivirgaceae bacterium]
MSRIGKSPVAIPAGVTITVTKDNLVEVKGPKGALQQQIHPGLNIKVEENELVVERTAETKEQKSMHGLYRSLINNMVVGVSEGYKIEMEFVGVGYRAESKGQMLEMSLGYSHNIFFELPPEIKVDAVTVRRSNPKLSLESYDKQLVGQIAAKIRAFRKPEPYKGKGILFKGEVLRRKAGKSAGA